MYGIIKTLQGSIRTRRLLDESPLMNLTMTAGEMETIWLLKLQTSFRFTCIPIGEMVTVHASTMTPRISISNMEKRKRRNIV